MAKQRPRIACPEFPPPLMRPHGSKPTHTPEQLLALLTDFYRTTSLPREIKRLPKTDLELLVAGLARDFVPIFRRSKNRGRRSNLPEWSDTFDSDPPDLKQLLLLANFVRKYHRQLGTERKAFAHIALHKRKELPSIFKDRRTGASLKQAFYKTLANYDDAPWIQERVKDDPDGARAHQKMSAVIARLKEKMAGTSG
jgi:hypothetical protein